MYKASPDQIRVLGEKEEDELASRLASKKQSFVWKFLELADSLAREGGSGSGKPVGRNLWSWEMTSSSDPVDLPAEEDSPDMAASVVAYRNELKRKTLKGEKVVASTMIAAEVQIGAASKERFPALLGAETVMRVHSNPPSVYYGEDEGSLMSVEPDTPEWNQMAELAATVGVPAG